MIDKQPCTHRPFEVLRGKNALRAAKDAGFAVPQIRGKRRNKGNEPFGQTCPRKEGTMDPNTQQQQPQPQPPAPGAGDPVMRAEEAAAAAAKAAADAAAASRAAEAANNDAAGARAAAEASATAAKQTARADADVDARLSDLEEGVERNRRRTLWTAVGGGAGSLLLGIGGFLLGQKLGKRASRTETPSPVSAS